MPTATPDGRRSPAPGRVAICHATGSHKRPYVLLSVGAAALDAHRRHHAGRDLVPAPAGGCPAAPPATGATTPAPEGGDRPRDGGGSAPDDLTPTISTADPGGDGPGGAPVLRPLLDSPGPDGRSGAVPGGLGLEASPRPGQHPEDRRRREDGAAGPRAASLPFTGGHSALLAAIGLTCCLAGLALRRQGRRSPPSVA